MMKVPPLSLVGMERLPLPLPFSPELLWRYNPLGPPTGASHHHAAAAAAAAAAQQSSPPSSSAAAVSAAAAAAFTRAAAAAAAGTLSSPIQQQLPFAFDLKTTIPIRLASDPRLWNREDVSVFLQWCEREFDLPSFDMDRFQMNGKALCLLTKADLESRAPCSGDVIHNALQLLMTSGDSPLTPHTPSSVRIPQLGVNGKGTTWSIADLQQYAAAQQQQQSTTSVTLSPAPSLDGQAGSPQDHGNGQAGTHLSSSSSSAGSGGPPSDDSEYDSVGESPERSPPIQSMSPPPSHNGSSNNHSTNGGHHHHLSHHHSNSSNGNSNGVNSSVSNANGVAGVTAKSSFSPGAKLTNGANGTAEPGEYNNNGRLLWDFLQQLLNDPAQRYSNFIAWKNVDTGIFKIVDPPGLARLWGIQKNHLSMNYDKMSRALRYYYRVNILRKVQGERHCYQFLRNPGELKSIKNISMLRHQQNSPMSLSVKSSDSMSYANENGNGNDYDSKYSLLSHHHQQQNNSPVSLTVKSEPVNYGNRRDDSPDDYETKLSMLGHRQQNSPVSLTTKNCSTSPSSSTSSTSSNSNGAPSNGDAYGDNGDYESNGHPQDSPMSLTTKSSASSDHHHHRLHQDSEPMETSSRGPVGHRPKPQLSPVSLSVKSEPSTAFICSADDDYEDVPTDLSMDTDRDRQVKDED